MDKFELQKLRDLPIEGVAERLGLRVERHKCLCPFHDDQHPSLTFSVSRNTFRCWACGAHGGTIDLAMQYLGKDFREACEWLGSDQFIVQSAESVAKSAPSVFDASRYSRYFEHPFLNDEARHFLFEERRLDPRVVRWCRLTSWRDRQGIPWLQIPYYNKEGKLVGVQNRNLQIPSNSPLRGRTTGQEETPSGSSRGRSNCSTKSTTEHKSPLPHREGWGGSAPRFRFPTGSECSIYNLPILNTLSPGEALYIAEGSSDCWALLSAGHKAIAIPSATLLTKKDKELLKSLSSSPLGEAGRGLSFHMYPDRDTPGERLFLQLQQILPNLEHHQLPPDCKDYSDYYVKIKNEK